MERLEFFKSDYIASKDVNAWFGLFKVKKKFFYIKNLITLLIKNF